KSVALIRLSRFDDANKVLAETLQKSKQSKDSSVLSAITQANIGFLYLNQGRNDLALDNLIQSTAALQQSGNSLERAQALAYLGQVYMSTGKYSQAEEQLQMALSLRLDKLPESHELIAASYNDLGLVYSQLDVDKAIDFYEKAIAIYEKLHGKEHPKMAIANTNLGVVYRSLELYGDAINYFETALAIWEKIYPQPHPSKAFVLSNLGQTYSKMNDQSDAMEFYKKALAMYIDSQGKKHPDVATTYNLIGNILTAQHKYDEALSHYQQALISNVTDFNSADLFTNPTGRNFYNGNVLLYSLMYKAQALESRHFGKTLKQSDLDFGLKTLQACDSLIDRLRQQSTNESDKIALGSIANEVYADGVRISFILSDVSFRHRESYRELSFNFAEKSKSAVLLDAISDTNAKSFAGIPPDLLEEEKSLKSAIALVSQKLAQKPDEEEEKSLRETSFQLNQSYQAFTQNLEKQYPEYFNLKFNSSSPSVVQLQRIIGQSTALLSYFIDEKNNRLYTYLITKKNFSIYEQPLPTDYDKNITGLRNSVFYMSLEPFIKSSRSLFTLLIPKIPSSIHDIVILPTGRMSIIPFEVLLTKEVKDSDPSYATLPYLLKKYSIRYEFSAGLLIQNKDEPTGARITSALLCAPVNFPEKNNLADLPGTEDEINTIQSLFASKNITSEVLMKKKANEAMLKSDNLQEHSIVHLATHGIVDENNPELSCIFLQTDSEAEDGNLFSGEIYNLRLKADLVTLSACQTGLGKISKGEGVIGLSRALVYAGANNIIVSFWSVGDKSTAKLMSDFYKLLLEKPTVNYTQNLRQAKLNLINGEFAPPYYWAPFVLIGF
ncbi:MAG: CHAT domain-containing protein, partial [Cyclobacteriaceae bacterium]|nr:CHAT domain-containing protein [Cyclobacteriaceae bacterium]